jgi:hypothetical protein
MGEGESKGSATDEKNMAYPVVVNSPARASVSTGSLIEGMLFVFLLTTTSQFPPAVYIM